MRYSKTHGAARERGLSLIHVALCLSIAASLMAAVLIGQRDHGVLAEGGDFKLDFIAADDETTTT